MRSLTPALALLLVPALLHAQPAPPARADLTSPESTVRSFVDLLNRRELTPAALCLEAAPHPKPLGELERTMKAEAAASNGQNPTFTVQSAETQIDGETATCTVTFTARIGTAPPVLTAKDDLRLRKAGTGWKLVTPAREEAVPGAGRKPAYLKMMVFMVANPEVFLASRRAADRATCANRLKQLGVALEMLLLDHDYRFNFKESEWKKALMPYIKREEPFRCPAHDGAAASYSFNARLAGLTVGRLQRPAATVVFYEGTGGKLDFRHDGLAHVVTADGELHALTRAQGGPLRWLP